jgi:nuclear pore complex protein Nup155
MRIRLCNGWLNLRPSDLRTSTPRMQFFETRSQLLRGSQQPQVGSNADAALQQFSAKHGSLYLYIGRILRPIWNIRCIKQECANGKSHVLSTVNAIQVGWILGHLQALRSFLNKNTHISKP